VVIPTELRFEYIKPLGARINFERLLTLPVGYFDAYFPSGENIQSNENIT
jgi:hypothetical protein